MAGGVPAMTFGDLMAMNQDRNLPVDGYPDRNKRRVPKPDGGRDPQLTAHGPQLVCLVTTPYRVKRAGDGSRATSVLERVVSQPRQRVGREATQNPRSPRVVFCRAERCFAVGSAGRKPRHPRRSTQKSLCGAQARACKAEQNRSPLSGLVLCPPFPSV